MAKGPGCWPVVGHHAGGHHHRRRRRPAALDAALRRPPRVTFDRLDVDGSCSTNDTVLLLASGASAITPSQDELDDAIRRVCDDLCATAGRRRGRHQAGHRHRPGGHRDDAVAGGRASPATAWSRPPVRLRPRTGAGCSPPVGIAPVTLDPNRIGVVQRFTGVHRRRRRSRAPATSTCPGRHRRHGGPGAGRRVRVHAHHRPVARLRRRELGVELMTGASTKTSTKATVLAEACRGSNNCTADRRRQVRRQRHDRRDAQGRFAADMVFLRNCGIHPVVVHGGGPQISAMLKRLGIAGDFKGGFASPPRGASTWPGWCCSVRSAANWST